MGLGKFGKRALVKKRGIFVKTFVISRNVKSDVVKITRSPKFVVAIQITYLCIICGVCGRAVMTFGRVFSTLLNMY